MSEDEKDSPERVAFRARLDEAIKRVGRKAVTRQDGELRQSDDDPISQGGLTKMLKGERSNPRIFNVKKIADAAGVSVGWLLGETDLDPRFQLTAEDRDLLRQFVEWAEGKVVGIRRSQSLLRLETNSLGGLPTPDRGDGPAGENETGTDGGTSAGAKEPGDDSRTDADGKK